MRIEHTIKVDFQRPGVRPVVRIVEGDASTRYIVANLYNGGEPFSVGSGVTGVVKYAKSDGHSGVYDTIDKDKATEHAAVVFHDSSKQAVIELAPNISMGFGLVALLVQFVSTSGTDILGTFPVDVIVERDPTDGTEAEDYFSYKALDELYAAIDEAKEDAAEALAAGLHDITAEYVAAKASRPTLTPDAFLLEQEDGLYRINDEDGDVPFTARVVTDRSGAVNMDVVEYRQGDRIERTYIDSTLITTVTMSSGDGAVTINPESFVGDLATAQSNISALQADTAALQSATTAMRDDVDVLNAYIFGIVPDPTDWAAVKAAVQGGHGKRLFPVGYEFTIQHEFMGNSVWVVRAHDYDPLGTELTGGKHNMVLEMKYAYGEAGTAYTAIQFDAKEAFFYAENGLPAGQYYITLADSRLQWAAGDYNFTFTANVPAGAHLVFSNEPTIALTSSRVQVYASANSTSPAQTATISSGAVGSHLGNIGISLSKCTEGFNSLSRAAYGSNNYAQSAIRQLLNSDAAAGSVWAQKTVFDRIPVWGTSSSIAHQGFRRGFANDFLQAISAQKLPCVTSYVFETGGYSLSAVYTIQDAFFLLSRAEVYGTYGTTSLKDGEILAYYDGIDNADRILYGANGVAVNKFLRTHYYGSADNENAVGQSSGSLSYNSPSYAHGIAPACIIG